MEAVALPGVVIVVVIVIVSRGGWLVEALGCVQTAARGFPARPYATASALRWLNRKSFSRLCVRQTVSTHRALGRARGAGSFVFPVHP